MILKRFFTCLLFLSPLIALALEDPTGGFGAAQSAIGKINSVIINPLITLLFALALVFFLWGVFQYVWQEESDAARRDGKNHMLWGLLGMFVMFAVFAIMKLIADTIGADVSSIDFL